MNYDFMDLAFVEAEKAFKVGEGPVGAVIVKNGKVIAAAYNQKEKKRCAIYHAEILAILKACKKLKSWRLDDCDMYVTLDPCPMCAGAIKQSRIKNVFSALPNADANNTFLIKEIFEKDRINSGVNFISDLSITKSETLLQKFFELQRKK